MRFRLLLAVLNAASPLFFTHALKITVPSTTIAPGPLTVTYTSETSDPAGNLTFWLAHTGGVGGFLNVADNVLPSKTPANVQIDLDVDDGDGQQWEVSAGPALQSVDGIFAFSSPFTIQNVTTATSASATSSAPNTATSSGFRTQSATGTSAQLTQLPSATNSSTTSQAKASASSSASAVPIKSSPSVGIIVGATFGATAFLLIALLLTFLYLRRMRRRRRMDAKEPILEAAFTPYAASSAYGYSSTNSMSQQQHANVEPFMPEPHDSPVEMSEPGPSLSSRASRARQEYLTSQMRAVQKQLEALEGARAMAAASQTTSGSDAMSSSGSEGDTGGLEQARRQNEALQERIRALEGQLQSQWALGLSDEPPPGYLE